MVWGLLAFLCGVWTTAAQAEGLRINSVFEGGMDAWVISPKQPDPPPPGAGLSNGSAYEDHNNLILPDSDTKWTYRPVSPWIRWSSNVRLGPDFEINLKMRADQLMGAHVDVANVDWSPSPYLGFRMGVVNFNTNWCRTYDVDSPWVAEPDAFCRSNNYMNINNAAPGVQTYTNNTIGEFQLQTVVGIYRPLLFSYEVKEFGFNNEALGKDFRIMFNRKISAALNLLNVRTGTQFRFGMMRSDEAGRYEPRPVDVENRSRHNMIDNYYIGVDYYVLPSFRLRYSGSKFYSQDFYDGVLVVQDKDRSETLEFIYELKATDLLAFGFSRFGIAASVDDLPYRFKADDYYHLSNQTSSISWRHQWGKGMYSTLQWTHASQTNGYEGRRRPGDGDAIGLRIGYQY